SSSAGKEKPRRSGAWQASFRRGRFSSEQTLQIVEEFDLDAVAPGQSIELRNLVFAGAKEVPVIDGYEASYSIPKFDR
ncbi:hypothetical protein ACC722_39480, partial [Rhizobium ruizarguesonis]